MLMHFRSFLDEFHASNYFLISYMAIFPFFIPFFVVLLLPCFQPDLAEGEVIKQDIMDLKEGLYQQVALL